MLQVLKLGQGYFVRFLTLWLLGLLLYLNHDHGYWVLFFNERHTPFLDFFFAYWTHTGSTLFFVILAALYLIMCFRKGLVLAITGISVLFVSRLLKQVIFVGVPRPAKYFEGVVTLKIVEGSTHVLYNAFPSGHTMAAFALATFFALSIQKNWASIALLLGAFLCGISRIYLGQHFLVDVLAGSLIGLLLSLAAVYFFRKRFLQDSLPQ